MSLGRDELGGTFGGEYPNVLHDKATVDQAIADVRASIGTWFRDINQEQRSLAALRVLADTVEKLRAERDRLREALDDTHKAAIDLSNDVTRLARQEANLEAALRPFAAQPCGKLSPSWDGPDFIPCGECKVCRARAALAAAHSREQQDG